jgi:hypothetical protein
MHFRCTWWLLACELIQSFPEYEMLLLEAAEPMHHRRFRCHGTGRFLRGGYHASFLILAEGPFYQNRCYNRVMKQADISPKVNPRPSLQTGLRVDSTTLTVPSVRFTLRCKFQRAVCRKHLDFLGKEITQEILSTLKMSWDALWICQRYSVVILEYVECL